MGQSKHSTLIYPTFFAHS